MAFFNPPLKVTTGGTGLTSLTANGVLIGNGTSAVTLASGTAAGQVLTWNSSGPPTFQTAGVSGVSSIAGTSNQVNLSASTGSVTVSLSSTLTLPGTLTLGGAITGGSYGMSGMGNIVPNSTTQTLGNSTDYWGSAYIGSLYGAGGSGSTLTCYANINPNAANSRYLGSSTLPWSGLYIGDGSSAYSTELNSGSGTLTANQLIQLPNASGTVALINQVNGYTSPQCPYAFGGASLGTSTYPWSALVLGQNSGTYYWSLNGGTTLTSNRVINIQDAGGNLVVSGATNGWTASQIPGNPGYYDLGSTSEWWRNLYIGTNAGYYAELTANGAATSNITLTMPTSTGTLALTSQIPSLTGYAQTSAANNWTASQVPNANNTYALGSSTLGWSGVYLGNGSYTTSVVPGTLSANTTLTLPSSSGTLALTSGVVTSVAGTANQITMSASTGAVTASLSSALTLPGTLTLGGNVTAGGYTLSGIGTVTPNTSGSTDLGSTAKAFRNLFLTDTTDTTYYAEVTVSALSSNVTITIPSTSSNTVVPASSIAAGNALGYVNSSGAQIPTTVVNSVAGTANQISISTASGVATASLPSAITLPGTLTMGGTLAVNNYNVTGVAALTPYTTASYYLGSSSLGWNGIYFGYGSYYTVVNPGTLTASNSLVLPTTSGTLALTSQIPSLTGYAQIASTNSWTSSQVPSANNSVALGSSTLGWSGAYLGNSTYTTEIVAGTLSTSTTLTLPTTTGTVALTSQIPTVAGTANQITATGTTSITLSLPSALTLPGTLTLGGNLSTNGYSINGSATIIGSVIPSTTTTYNLGTSSFFWNAGYISSLYGPSNVITAASSVVPSSVSYSLGSTGTGWGGVYLGSTTYTTEIVAGSLSANNTITLPTTTGTMALTSQIPTVSGTANQITSTTVGSTVTISLPSAVTLPGTLTLGGTVTAGGNSLSGTGTITPNINANYYLGSVSLGWAGVYYGNAAGYTGNIIYSSSGTSSVTMTIAPNSNSNSVVPLSSATSNQVVQYINSNGVQNTVLKGSNNMSARLYLVSGNPTQDASSVTSNFYVGPYNGSYVDLPDTTGNVFTTFNLAEISTALPSYFFRMVDVFLYNSSGSPAVVTTPWDSTQTSGTITAVSFANPAVLTSTNSLTTTGGQYIGITGITGTVGTYLNGKVFKVASATSTTITLETGNNTTGLAYTSGGTWYLVPTARATGLTYQNGRYLQTGNLNYLYIGTMMVGAQGTSARTDDSTTARLVWNALQQVPKYMVASDTSPSWTYTTATYRPRNNSLALGTARNEFVVGLPTYQAFEFTNAMTISNTSVGIGMINNINLNSVSNVGTITANNVQYTNVASDKVGGTGSSSANPILGYNFAQVLETVTAATGTMTAYGTGTAVGMATSSIQGWF